MIHPIPSGTRDVLPEESAELRSISEALRATFTDFSYGEIYTPALEYESVLARGDLRALEPAYRLFDHSGQTLVLRTDMTVPIARVVATRYADSEPPLRFCYFAHCYRRVRPERGRPRELLQAGIELIGSPAPAGTAEVLTVLVRALRACGLERFRIGLGDAALYPQLMSELEVPALLAERLLDALSRRNFVALSEELDRSTLPEPARELLRDLPQRRGDPQPLLSALPARAAAAAEGLSAILALLEGDVAERVILDLGLVRELGYYTGAIFEVYDPALGHPIGGGGRYDDLLGRFGRPLPAVGFALGLERLHIALAGEERGENGGLP
ncbi:MAG TPA: ATP phosphoribosyltransferase regulatory subunit [Solirubrobacteraceae bacterium]|nr:ATP phosphoribosyltransferase regulatory subunit [Solirubrobacteraceae bacterium]